MKDKSKLLAAIQNHRSFLLTAHIFPDGDNIGSLMALRAGLLKLGKKVQVVIDDKIPFSYHFIAGSQDIVSPDRVDLGFEALVVLDTSSIDRIGAVQRLCASTLPLLNIDHHISNTGFGTLQYIDTNAAATAEIIYQLLSDLGVEFDAQMATAIYTGIATDCGFFKYANTTCRAMRIAAEMIDRGAQPNEISDALKTRSLSALRLLARVLDGIHITANGKIAWVALDDELLNSVGADQETADGFINYVRYIEGVEIAILFRDIQGSGVKVSMRSRQQVDVSQIALQFGGGGHKRAAGCCFEDNLASVKERILAAITEKL